ncbi:hypothetical protein CXB51_004519 [Gossypium anomalum]|uniref:Uncharacterized protein n=1 Tax=Gossypium anomalum TaxID=47600 RepID=A0A8J5ZEL8_9ROSI|nr:hypothetical protein CXB51_004519 [Gossypium anomalum]
MKTTMANLWHPVRSVRILDSGEKRFLFQFFHSMDMERIHDIPAGYYSEALAKQLGEFIGLFLEYDGANMGKGYQNFLRVRIQLDVRSPLKRKKQIIDSFCEAKMALGTEITEMGWDLSLRAQSRKARAQSSIWLRKEKGGIRDGYFNGNKTSKQKTWGVMNNSGKKEQIDPVLGFSLEGITSSKREGKKPVDENQISMDHDAEEGNIIGEEGNKWIGGCQKASRSGTMKILSWNVCGLGNPRTNCIEVDLDGSRGGLCLAWHDDATIILLSFSKRHIDVVIEDTDKGHRWRFTGFYGSPYTHDRNESWDLLRNLSNSEELPCASRLSPTGCGLYGEMVYLGKGGNDSTSSTFLFGSLSISYHDEEKVNEQPKKSFKFEAWWMMEESFVEKELIVVFLKRIMLDKRQDTQTRKFKWPCQNWAQQKLQEKMDF